MDLGSGWWWKCVDLCLECSESYFGNLFCIIAGLEFLERRHDHSKHIIRGEQENIADYEEHG